MLTLLLSLQAAPQRPAQLTQFLQQSIGFDTEQLAAVERGEPVVKVLEAHDRRDVVVFGIITLPVAREQYVRALRDFPTSLRTPNRTQLGIFSDPATEADVAAVTIDNRDVREMKNCKPGDCVVKLPATDMRRIHDQTNWSAPDVQAQLSGYARRRLVEYVTDYRRRGDSAMAVYDDRGNLNVRSSEAFAAQLAESPYVYQTVPSLRNYLADYPRNALPPGAAEIVFWSEDVLPHLRPILSVTHLVVYTPPELPGMTLAAAKQIYANHYFEAAVDLTAVVDRNPGAYLVVLRRYRFDNLPGGILNIRGRAINALRDQLTLDLRRQQQPGSVAR
ncbi:MAG TPA: hypothetical protein VGQ29_09030 [Gemmatimonadales bacterium]|jgi:hypothetical protein|nr:hypothetical protein [Gemmatimonadales bacterium]